MSRKTLLSEEEKKARKRAATKRWLEKRKLAVQNNATDKPIKDLTQTVNLLTQKIQQLTESFELKCVQYATLEKAYRKLQSKIYTDSRIAKDAIKNAFIMVNMLFPEYEEDSNNGNKI